MKYKSGKILAEIALEDREYTVEIVNTDGECVTIESDIFPLVFVRHQGWCKQPCMTVDKKYVRNIRFVTDDGEVVYPNDKPEVAPWDEIPQIVDGVSSPEWFAQVPEVEM